MSKTLYKRKEIDFSPSFWEDKGDFSYLHNVMENYHRLMDIHDGKIPYISSDYALLIHTFEQLYKGVLRELQNMYPDKIVCSNSVYTSGHHFSQFAYKINEFIPVSNSNEGFEKVHSYLKDLEYQYNNARYDLRKTPQQFREDFRKLERGIYRFTEGLKIEYDKNYSSEEEEADLEDW